MDLLLLIREAIMELECQNIRSRDELIIAFSPLTERYLVAQIQEYYRDVTGGRIGISSYSTLEGVRCYNKHPYNNEIVVYHPDCAYNEKLKAVIKWEPSNIKPITMRRDKSTYPLDSGTLVSIDRNNKQGL